MFLFIIQLYNQLPHYQPRQPTIIFSCVLGEEVTKTIELTNPTNKPISYWVKYDGSPDFIPEFLDSFKIEPKMPFKFKIRFVSRVFQPVTGRIMFTNKKESTISAAALVFSLKSEITGRTSVEHWKIKSNLYTAKEFYVQI